VPAPAAGNDEDSIIDPDGDGPRIWFQIVPDPRTVKNRLHLDIHASGGRAVPIETRRQRVDAEAKRLPDLGATVVGAFSEEGIDHYAVAMKDPEGNEFDIN
jgi:Glyoxalase-like domain